MPPALALWLTGSWVALSVLAGLLDAWLDRERPVPDQEAPASNCSSPCCW